VGFGVEALECRTLLSITSVIKNINTVGLYPQGLNEATAVVDNRLIFVANDGVEGPAVWGSDGTSAGTVLLADVDPQNIVTYTNGLGQQEAYFAGDSSIGPALWETNGTVAGTSVVDHLDILDSGNVSYDLTVVGGKLLFFSGPDVGQPTPEFNVWASNGTYAGTSPIGDFPYSTSVSAPIQVATAGGMLFFTGADTSPGPTELYVTNGQVLSYFDYFSGPYGTANYDAAVTDLTGADGLVFFTVSTGSTGPQAWVSNGTVAGTMMLTDFAGAPSSGGPSNYTQVGDEVYFTVPESAQTVALWKTNGTVAGTVEVTDDFPTLPYQQGAVGPELDDFTALGTTLYFKVEYPTSPMQSELWESNGTAAGTQEIAPASLPAGATFSSMSNLVVLGNMLLFTTADGGGSELWESNGTAAGTTVVDDNGPSVSWYDLSAYDSNPDVLLNNGVLYFVGTAPNSGTELWQTDGAAAGTEMVTDMAPGGYSSGPVPLGVLNDQLLFFADDGAQGRQLWGAQLPEGPTITPVPAQTALVNQQLSLQIDASDSSDPGAALAYSLIEGPPVGAAISSTGDFTWTPTPAQSPGVYNITVLVDNMNGSCEPGSVMTFQVSAQAAATQVVITSPPLDIAASAVNSSLLYFTPAGVIGEIALELGDQYGDLGAVSSQSQTITLGSTSSNGRFYAVSWTADPITSVVIPAGQSTAIVYYEDGRGGAPTISATDTALASTSSQQATVDSGPAQMVPSGPPADVPAGTIADIQFEFQNASGYGVTPASAQTISLTSTSPTGVFYFSPSGSPVSSIVVPAGQSTFTVWYADTSPGFPTISAVDPALPSPESSQTETIAAVAGASQVAITSSRLNLEPGTRAELVIQVQNSSGVAADAQQTLALKSSSPTGVFLSTGYPTTQVNSVSVIPGQSTETVYYSDTEAGTYTITVWDAALGSAATQSVTVSPGAPSSLAFLTVPSPTATAGVPFAVQPVVAEVDQYGNIVTDDDTTAVTAWVAGGNGGVAGQSRAVMSAGVAAFANLTEDFAGRIQLKFSAGSLPALTAIVTVAAGPASQLAIAQGPPSPVAAGQPFDMVVDAQDQFHNVATGFNGAVTLALCGDSAFPVSVQAIDGVATFTGLSVTAADAARAIQVSATGLSGTDTDDLYVAIPNPTPTPTPTPSPTPAPTSTPKPTPAPTSTPTPTPAPTPTPSTTPAPTVVLASVATVQKMKKGKPAAKPVFSGFTLKFSEPMNAATAGDAADYQVLSMVVTKSKKGSKTSFKPVAFAVSYVPAIDSVTIHLTSTKPFAKGGELKLIGLTSQDRVRLSSNDTILTIAANADGISGGLKPPSALSSPSRSSPRPPIGSSSPTFRGWG
jgi:ELWxxDGT repeat protein